MFKLIKRIVTQISIRNFKLFFLYIKDYGIKYTLQLFISFLAEKEILPNFIYNYFRNSTYQKWILENESTEQNLIDQKEKIDLFENTPLISIIVATYNTQEKMLKEMIESVINQTYSNWELCIADGNSSEIYVGKILKKYAGIEPRIRIKTLASNYGIAGNSNETLSLANGHFIALLDHDDTLAPFALYEVVEYINANQGVDFVYSDEDKLSNDGCNRFDPFFKPDWGPSPDTLCSYNYFGHLSVIRRSLFSKTEKWFNEEFEGSQDYDLYLRIIEKTNRIGHIPKILYHWRSYPLSAASSGSAKPYAIVAGRKTIKQHMTRQGIDCEIEIVHDVGRYKAIHLLDNKPFISIIIPTKDNVIVLKKCINSILQKSSYKNFEIVIVNNQSHEPETDIYIKSLKQKKIITVLNFDKAFNYSAINNYAASYAKGDILLFLNNDTEVISKDWLEEMLGCIQRDDVGAVGPKLLYTNDTIQNAGIVLGVSQLCGEAYKYYKKNHSGSNDGLIIKRNVTAVTGACVMIKKHVFERIGGFDENLQVAYSDVDLCLKVRKKEYLIVWTPFAELYHHERLTRGRPSTKEKWTMEMKERKYLSKKWQNIIENGDPYYNPNFNQDRADFKIG